MDKNTIVCGLQWGDEGKGKIVDYLTEHANVIIRSQGGNNAGHTVMVGDNKYVLHLMPSGAVWNNKLCIIGNGVALDPIALIGEIDYLADKNIAVTPDKLIISDRAHVVMPYHQILDEAREKALGKNKLGTTKRGIGPTYAHKAHRTGLRLADLIDESIADDLIEKSLLEVNPILQEHKLSTLCLASIKTGAQAAINALKPYIKDTVPIVHQAWQEGKKILFEGAQGSLLDIDFGTYPFVTSSSTVAGGATTGSGLPPLAIQNVIGVCKAYTTRVGQGAMPTENQELSDYFHNKGMEFGATTGRARRCGWLDTVLLRYAVMVNGVTELAVTILDGLDTIETIRICTAYEIDGKQYTTPPANRGAWQRIKPIYIELPGWQEDTSTATNYHDLPELAKNYLNKISELVNAPIKYVGNGPGRQQTLVLD